ncbi:MAG TPA: hypothetical protein VFI91_11840 [Longimicrobiaceae bacterium]|nr:hypothetical protein [Longimicrobiaceae bacterium]
MFNNRVFGLSLIVMLAGAIGASPALAQGKSKAHKKDKHRQVEVQKRFDERPELQRRRGDDRIRWPGEYSRARKDVPPGWCKGKGNPHNTPENCGYSRDILDWGLDRDRRDTRYPYPRRGDRDRIDRDSYAAAHRDFHRIHDRQCRELSSRRPLDPVYQLRVRAECKMEHDRWHDRVRIRH